MTATYTKPTAIPRWADTSTNILEPPEAKKDEGWLFEEIPPSSFENWRTNLIGSWAKWLDERLFDGASKDEFLIKSPGAGTEAIRITDTYVKVSRDLRVEGDDLGVEVDGTTSRRIYFDSSKLNWLGYSIGGSRMELYAGGVLALWADATQCYINGDIVIGDDLSVPGGLAVGIASPSYVDDVIQLGDIDNRWEFNAGAPRFIFDHFGGSIDALSFDRVNSRLSWINANVEKARFEQAGLSIADGLRIGFLGTPTSDRIELGDPNMFLQFDADVCEFDFASGCSFSYSRTNSRYAWLISTTEQMRLTASGLAVGGGLYVGTVAGTPVDNAIIADGDGTFAGGLRVGFAGTPTADRIELGDTIMFLQYSATPYLQFDTGDQFGYDRAADRFWFVVSTSEEMRIRGDGVAIANGLYVGNLTGVPTDDQINVADANFYLKLATDPYIYFDSLDFLQYVRSTNSLDLYINNVQIFQFYGTLIRFHQPVNMVGASPINWVSPGANPTIFGNVQTQAYTGKLVSGDGSNTVRYLGTIHTAYEINRTTTGVFSTCTIPANTLAAGSRIHARLRAHGLIGTTGWTAVIKIGGNIVGQCGGGPGAVGDVDVEAIVSANPGGAVNVYTSHLGLDSGGASHSISYQLIGLATNAAVAVTAELTFASGTPSITLRTFTVDVN